MRKALVVGIDYYQHISQLHGCVNDAHSVKAMLDRHADGSVNFDVRLIAGLGPQDILERAELRAAIQELFNGDDEVALLFFGDYIVCKHGV